MKLLNVHCPNHWLLPFPDHFASFLLFSTAYRRQKGTTIQHTGEENGSTRLQPQTWAFYWCQSDCKIHLYWLQCNSPTFYLSTGAMSQGLDVASLQIRTHKLLLPHRWIYQKVGNKWLPGHALKDLVVWSFLNNIIRFTLPVLCITSKSDIYLFTCTKVKPIYTQWGNGDCFINFALKHTTCALSYTHKRKVMRLAAQTHVFALTQLSPFRNKLSWVYAGQVCLAITLVLWNNCVSRKTYIQE